MNEARPTRHVQSVAPTHIDFARFDFLAIDTREQSSFLCVELAVFLFSPVTLRGGYLARTLLCGTCTTARSARTCSCAARAGVPILVSPPPFTDHLHFSGGLAHRVPCVQSVHSSGVRHLPSSAEGLRRAKVSHLVRLKISTCCLFEVPAYCSQTWTPGPGDTDQSQETEETLETPTRLGPGALESPTNE